MKSGFSVVELAVTMSVFAILVAFTAVNFVSLKSRTSLSTTADILVSDLKTQQIKAMVGETEGVAATTQFGVRLINTGNYVIYKGTYSAADTSNFTVSLGDGVTQTNGFANGDIIFKKGNGELLVFPASPIITLRDKMGNQKIVTFNKLGVVTNVN